MKIKKMKIYNTIQNSGTVMHFLVQNLKIKNSEQLKHRSMSEILWIYGTLGIVVIGQLDELAGPVQIAQLATSIAWRTF